MHNNPYEKYIFNPFQFAGNERATRTFHKKMVRNFARCNNVIDIGCGNGGFLQVLEEAGIAGFGIDASGEAVQHCLSRGLLVENWEVRDYLTSQKAEIAKFDGIYCAHLIEHLTPERVFELFSMIYEATRIGTKMVVVTPNFNDLGVAGEIFWLDVTHVRPYPGLLVRNMLETVGFREAAFRSMYGLGLNRSILVNYLINKVRFGKRIYRPNLVITAVK